MIPYSDCFNIIIDLFKEQEINNNGAQWLLYNYIKIQIKNRIKNKDLCSLELAIIILIENGDFFISDDGNMIFTMPQVKNYSILDVHGDIRIHYTLCDNIGDEPFSIATEIDIFRLIYGNQAQEILNVFKESFPKLYEIINKTFIIFSNQENYKSICDICKEISSKYLNVDLIYKMYINGYEDFEDDDDDYYYEEDETDYEE